jgi:low temperature requirement protein LtrA
MFQHVLDLISFPFLSESITQQKKVSKLAGIMMIPLSSLLGLIVGVVIYKTGLSYIHCLIACSILSIVAGLTVGLHHVKTNAHPSKLTFILIGLIYPLSFTLGFAFLFFVKP